jgi:hypothetical protein
LTVQDSTWQRWGGAGGILATASFVTESVLLRHSPSTDQPTSDLTSYFSANRPTALAGTYLLGLGAAALLCFLGALRSRLGRDGPLDGLASVGFAGGVTASAVVVAAAAGMVAVLAFRPATTPPVARALYDANGLLVALAGFPAAVLLSASSVAVLSSGGLPRWLGWFGLLAAAAQPVGAASFQRSGWLMPQGDTVALQAEVGTLLLWLLATSILMLLGRPTARRQAARAARHRPQVTNSKVGKPKGSGSNGPIGCSQPRLQRAL